MLVVVATVGTTLAPWGLTFVQSYAVDKHLVVAQLRAERADVVVGAVLTGVIGVCVAVACAATLHPRGIHVDDAAQAAQALRPAVGSMAGALLAVGLVGAALLAAAVLPLATGYAVCEAAGRPAHVGGGRHEPLFHITVAGSLVVAGALVLLPGVPLVPVLFLTQALNAVLLVPVLWLIRHLASDARLMGAAALSRLDRGVTGVVLSAITASVVTLAVLTL
jgi:Mn2+/Fe2+ NRAMP family transporter